jgi:amidohydrolase
MNNLKTNIQNIVDSNSVELIKLSQYIHKNPELGYKEFKAQKALTDFLSDNGFSVEKGVADIETSFSAEYKAGNGPTIAFVAEYDALPDIGHACGHNIIGTSAIGAGVAAKCIVDEYGGTIKVIGTPAEELIEVKQKMIDAGIFDDIDAAMLMHPVEISMADDISFAATNIKYIFHGEAAHAAAFPWKGKSALSGVIELFNSVNALRVHLRDYTRIHGIISDGGRVTNIIPEKAVAEFNIRALDMKTLNEIIGKVNKCAEGSALVTDTEVTIQPSGHVVKDIRNNKTLVSLMKNNMGFIGEKNIPRTLEQGIGSTDMGNLTHAIPSVQSYIGIGATGTHTKGFEKASGSSKGDQAVIKAAKIMALTALDIISDKSKLEEIKKEFEK